MELPGSAERVPLHTAPDVNDRIVARTLRQIAAYDEATPEERALRRSELDGEWDTERVLETTDKALLLAAGLLGLLTGRRWLFAIPAAVGFFLLQHALQGWCLEMPLLRRAGVRTPYEIAGEKAALPH
jgi:hypothetical protein